MDHEQIGISLMSFSKKMRRTINATLMEKHINTMQAHILSYLKDHPSPVCQKDLQEACSVRRSTISGVIDTMERNGLIVRRGGKDDKRKKEIVITRQGERLSHCCEDSFEAIERELSDVLDDKEKETFLSILGKLQGQLEHMHG